MKRLFNLPGKHQLTLVLVILGLLLGEAAVLAAEAKPSAYLAFACDGTAPEQRVLQEQSGTWIIQQSRAFAMTGGRVVYRVPVGKAELERLQFEVNLVPYRLEFSADGQHWDLLVSTAGVTPNPGKFSTQGTGFTPAQREAAKSSGYAWFRFQPAGQSSSEILRVQFLRLEVSGAELPPQFVRPSWWRQFASSYAAGTLMLAVGAVPILFLWWRWRTSWRVWSGGAALWAVSVALKVVCAALTNGLVYSYIHVALARTWADPVYWGYVGSLTGVFECGIFLVVAPLLRRREWSWREALSLGVGFGAIEAIALGAASLSVSQATVWGIYAPWTEALVPAFERFLALLIHIAAVVLIMRGVLARQWRWFAAGFVYKSAVDAVAAWVSLSGTGLRASPWLMESVCFGPFAVIGVVVLMRMWRRWRGWEYGARSKSKSALENR